MDSSDIDETDSTRVAVLKKEDHKDDLAPNAWHGAY